MLLNVPGYMSVFLDRKTAQPTGFGFRIENNLQVVIRQNLSTNNEQVFDSLVLDALINAKEKVIIGKMCRSPNGSAKEFSTIYDVLQKIYIEKSKIYWWVILTLTLGILHLGMLLISCP